MVSVLEKLSDHELLEKTKSLVAQERELATAVLWHLKEVSDRRLYAARGFCSLFDYAVKELNYSEPAAARRISAMKLLTQVPEIATGIANGSLNLSTVSAVQNFFKREEMGQGKIYSPEEKRKILDSMAHKSKRECESLLATLSPDSVIPPEKVRPVTRKYTELRIIVEEETLKKLQKLRDLLAHQNPDGSFGKLLELISEIALEKIDPVRKEQRVQKRNEAKEQRSKEQSREQVEDKPKERSTALSEGSPETEDVSEIRNSREKNSPTPAELESKSEMNPRHIPEQIRRQVFLRDGGRCTYEDPITGRVCGSKYKLQVDHIKPIALGGDSHIDNLRTTCSSHNQWEAISKLGTEAMAPFIWVRDATM